MTQTLQRDLIMLGVVAYGNDIKSFIKGVLINSTWRSSRSIGSVYFVLEY
ncbi:hypothetical protein JCM16161A_13640 [Vulcanisaeta sp. JCM 16161]